MHTPTRKLSNKQLKNKNKPWITKGIRKSILKRDTYLKKFINCKVLTIKNEIHTKYKFYRNTIVNLIKISKNNYYKKFFNDNIKNSRQLWKGINDIIHNQKNKNINSISLKLNDDIVNDQSAVASAFNDFFSSIAQNLQDKIPNFGNFENYVNGNPSPDSFFFKPVTQTEMLKTMNSLNHSKSTGDYSIPKQLFDYIPNELASILRYSNKFN